MKKLFISYDVTSHNGGFWKVATSVDNLWNGIRLGTYNRDLTTRIAK